MVVWPRRTALSRFGALPSGRFHFVIASRATDITIARPYSFARSISTCRIKSWSEAPGGPEAATGFDLYGDNERPALISSAGCGPLLGGGDDCALLVAIEQLVSFEVADRTRAGDSSRQCCSAHAICQVSRRVGLASSKTLPPNRGEIGPGAVTATAAVGSIRPGGLRGLLVPVGIACRWLLSALSAEYTASYAEQGVHYLADLAD